MDDVSHLGFDFDWINQPLQWAPVYESRSESQETDTDPGVSMPVYDSTSECHETDTDLGVPMCDSEEEARRRRRERTNEARRKQRRKHRALLVNAALMVAKTPARKKEGKRRMKLDAQQMPYMCTRCPTPTRFHDRHDLRIHQVRGVCNACALCAAGADCERHHRPRTMRRSVGPIVLKS
jgi:hypothetical protein